jgi:hypothetical protein
MKKMQQQLNKQIQDLKDELAKDPGGKQKGGKPGESGTSGGSTSEKLAKMAAQQEALRRMLNDVQNELGDEKGGAHAKQIKEMQQLMEQTEKDLVNKRITQETINRQQEIMSRLLESEKADRERDTDEKRSSNSAKDSYERNLNEFFRYKDINKESVTEMLKYQSVPLNSFYNEKVNRYLNTID